MITAENLEVSNDVVVLCSLQATPTQTCEENTAIRRLFRCMTQEVLKGYLADLWVFVSQERQQLKDYASIP